MPRKRSTTKLVLIGVRLSTDWVERVDQHALQLGEQMGGMTVSRAEAARLLIIQALNNDSRRTT